ncbi:PHP domain-containing protein [Nocardiopsis tropica]|uniref:DNA-directed DNA polymerase n=1 Tax=Nocardiopsis tropica TaxID=109330 RepID=A0ABV1ZQD3_9ACTN
MRHGSEHTDFAHLGVASSFSAHHGTCPPERLAARAADLGQDVLALTDRDGVYGMVRHVDACRRAGIRPVLGCDLALDSPDGGRVTLLARGRTGWATLCRLVTRAHAHTRSAPGAGHGPRPERGPGPSGPPRVPEAPGAPGAPALPHAAVAGDPSGVVVLLGPDSDVGEAVARERPSHARRLLARWKDAAEVAIAVADHGLPGQRRTARALLALAAETRTLAVLTNAVRYPVAEDAEVAHVLDQARRWAPGGSRPGPATDRAYLKSGAEMLAVADRLCGGDTARARRLIAHTAALASSCVLDPAADLGMGGLHLPSVPHASDRLLRACEDGLVRLGLGRDPRALHRLSQEMEVIENKRLPAYFLTVADAAARIRDKGIRCSIRGSGTGSLVNHLLGVSAVNPLDHGLLMERFLGHGRPGLPDIDLDVESARRLEAYDAVFGAHPGGTACVSMTETYRARSALREVGSALRLPPLEVDRLAKAFPHLRASGIREAARELPELRRYDGAGLDDPATQNLFRLAERLDGLPRHTAMHPCGLVVSDDSLRDRVPVEPSPAGYPVVQLDKNGVERMGLVKLDVIGVRMQSALAHARSEVERTTGRAPDLEALPRDEATYAMIGASLTLGCFQIESPGQRELLSRLRPADMADLIADISLFRPGPVKSDMVTPYLSARDGAPPARSLTPLLDGVLAETGGVVIWHEQIIALLHAMTTCGPDRAEAMRRRLGTEQGRADVREEFTSMAYDCGHDEETVERAWEVVASFGSFGFCKAHAAAFALPTYQSAWLKRHHPAAFYAGILTHDPGMYPRRVLVADARRFGVPVLGVDVNRSERPWRAERAPDGRWGVRASLADVRGVTGAEVDRILAERPFLSLPDAAERAHLSREALDSLVRVGAFDALSGVGGGPDAVPGPRAGGTGAEPPGEGAGQRGAGPPDRRDLLLQVSALERSRRTRTDRGQLPLPLEGTAPARGSLPATTADERVSAELEVLGYEVERHLLDGYADFLAFLAVRHRLVRAQDLHLVPAGEEVLVAGVKVATQTPAVRSGQRIVFATVDDATGLADLTFFASVQHRCAATVFSCPLLAVRGRVRRSGTGMATVTASHAHDLSELHRVWEERGAEALAEALRADPSAVPPGPPPGRSAPGPLPGAARRRLWHASPGSSGR